jgi:hypothetical protein
LIRLEPADELGAVSVKGTRTYPSGLLWAQEAFGLEGAFVPNLTPAAPQISAECSPNGMATYFVKKDWTSAANRA